MTKPKKKQQGKKKKPKGQTKRAPPRPLCGDDVVAEARTQRDPLSSLPPSFLRVPLTKPPLNNGNARDVDCKTQSSSGNASVATVRYFSSPLPDNLLRQCLELFQTNMGDMYRQSKWGLDVEEKERELRHPDARFLVALSEAKKEDATTAPRTTADDHENCTVLGFAHVRYELDEDDDDAPRPPPPIAYLYELQVNPAVQGLGLGKRLMTVVELLSLRLRLKKVVLTVFYSNQGAMGFYRKNAYVVDACSPSNFAGEENEGADYEILSKALG